MNRLFVTLAILLPTIIAHSWAQDDAAYQVGKRIEQLIEANESVHRHQTSHAETQPSSQTSTSGQSKETPEHGTAPKIQVSITGLDDPEQKTNAEAFLAIYAENGNTVKNTSYINYLANSGVEQIQQALHPFGYYLATVKLTQEKTAQLWHINYHVQRGKPVILNKKDIQLSGTGKNHPEFTQLVKRFPLKKGDILLQPQYTDFKDNLIAAATDDGFFDADFSRKQILIDESYERADVHLNYDTGIRYQFDNVSIKQDFLDQDVFDRYKTFAKGEPYNSKKIANLQRDLYNSGYIKVIDVTATPDKANKTVPVELAITPKKNKKHTFGIGYGTDNGIRGRYDFDWRWVNRRGHKFNTDLFLSQNLQKAGANYIIPSEKPATDYYSIFANIKRDRSGDVESTLWNLGGAYQDKKGHLKREFGIKWQQEDFTLGNDSGNVGLLTPYVKLTYLRTDNPLDTHDGLLLGLSLTGAHESLLSDVSLFQAIARAKYIKRFNEKHKLTTAGSIGRTWTKDFHQLPAAYRFFTGGDRTVRGYRFNHIGDKDSSGKVIGGDNMFYTSAEYEYFFRPQMAAAFFVDAGDAYSEGGANVKVGAGVGFHYYSPIGPIKVDLAHGFDEPGDKIRLHLSIGPELQ